MNAQSTLFDDLSAQAPPIARARRSDPATSHSAARSVKDLRASQYAVLRCFYECGPMHDELLLARYAGPPQSQSGLRTRRHELQELGLLEDSGTTSLTVGGRATTVWQITFTGRQAANERVA